MSVCHTSVLHQSHWTDRAGFSYGCLIPYTHPTLCYKETRVSPKMRILPSGTLSQTLSNVATTSRSRSQQNSLTTLTTIAAPWLGGRCYILTVLQLHYTSIYCGLVVELVLAVVQQFTRLRLTKNSASRGPSAAAELLVQQQTT